MTKFFHSPLPEKTESLALLSLTSVFGDLRSGFFDAGF